MSSNFMLTNIKAAHFLQLLFICMMKDMNLGLKVVYLSLFKDKYIETNFLSIIRQHDKNSLAWYTKSPKNTYLVNSKMKSTPVKFLSQLGHKRACTRHCVIVVVIIPIHDV